LLTEVRVFSDSSAALAKLSLEGGAARRDEAKPKKRLPVMQVALAREVIGDFISVSLYG
jgi:hypothetical protein